jgi:archaellum biogenesis ATPase FlaH
MREPVNSVELLIKSNPEFFDVHVLAAFMTSRRFWEQNHDRIDLFHKHAGQDCKFRTIAGNVLYEVVSGIHKMSMVGDHPIPPTLVLAYLSQFNENGQVPGDEYGKCLQLLDLVANSVGDATVASVDGPMFDAWFNAGLFETYAQRKLNSPYRADFNEVLSQMDEISKMRRKSTANVVTYQQSLVMPDDVRMDSISTGMGILDQHLGGGLLRGTSTVVAAISGGGKTVLASQLARNVAGLGARVLSCTTEMLPHQLTARIVSNGANIPIQDFRVGTDGFVIPTRFLENHITRAKIDDLHGRIDQNIRYLNWADGERRSVEMDLEPELDSIINHPTDPWMPDVLLFDWIGGALVRGSNRERRDVYYEAAEELHHLAKSKNIAVVMFAQLNKRLARNKKICTADMLSECTDIPNNATNSIFVSALLESGGGETGDTYQTTQYFNVDKSRFGPTGFFEVQREFNYQRFRTFRNQTATP